VICTQPRRLAVVSIASHVAELVGCDLGQDVGFRIGQKSVASRRTRMMFTTSGLLLEELRSNVSDAGGSGGVGRIFVHGRCGRWVGALGPCPGQRPGDLNDQKQRLFCHGRASLR
jgi:hypothetical protein